MTVGIKHVAKNQFKKNKPITENINKIIIQQMYV